MQLSINPEPVSTNLHFFAESPAFGMHLRKLASEQGCAILLDGGLGKIWQQRIIAFGVSESSFFTLPPGESGKDLRTVEKGLGFLIRRNHERQTPIIVIGGGAASDVGGLIAGLYRRGAPLVLVPTTLLAMVDAAVGGKTAVDYVDNGRLFKNVAGSFYPARDVLYWNGWLESLPARERMSGAGELLKTLWLDGVDISLQPIQQWMEGADPGEALWDYIRRAVQIKCEVVAQDPYDHKGIRDQLNYGHTLGHAFESIGAGRISHGEAVAWGMWAESTFISDDRIFPTIIRQRLADLGMHNPEFLRGTEPGQIAGYLQADKKIKSGRIHLSALKGFGELERVSVAPHELAKFAATLVNNQ